MKTIARFDSLVITHDYPEGWLGHYVTCIGSTWQVLRIQGPDFRGDCIVTAQLVSESPEDPVAEVDLSLWSITVTNRPE